MEGQRQELRGATRVGVEGSGSCRGGRRGTGCLGVFGVGRLVLFNHLAQPFGKVEVSPDGEEALCSGVGRGFIHSCDYKTESRDGGRAPGLSGSQSSGRVRQSSSHGFESEVLHRLSIREGFPEEVTSQLRCERWYALGLG